MKKLALLLLLIFPYNLYSQVTAVSGNVVDSDGTTWANGRWQVSFVPNPNYPNINSYNINGVQLNSSTYNSYLAQQGNLDGSGGLNVNLLDNSLIAPTGTTWKFTITPNASVPATTYPNLSVNGPNFFISSFLSTNATPIRFPAAGYGSYGYADSEISILPLQGAFYWNVTAQAQRVWTGSAWTQISYSGTGSFCPLIGCIFTGPISGTTAIYISSLGTYANFGITTVNINGVPQADQFLGADACIKLQNAITYALGVSPAITLIDATHFTGVQACSVNPFSGISGYVNLTINFGSVKFQTLQLWTITASGLSLIGNGPASTQIEYMGSGSGVIGIVNFTGTQHNKMDGFFIYGGPSPTPTVTTAFYIQATHRSEFSNMSFWGATQGMQTAGAVSDTFFRDHISVDDATHLLSDFGSGLTTPTTGWILNAFGGNSTTAGTAVDFAAEGVSGSGIHIIEADSMTFTSGTSEANGQGITIDQGSPHNLYNTFIGMDIESNTTNTTGVDILDNGGSTIYQNVIADSPCTGGCTHSVSFPGSIGGQQIIGEAGFNTGWSGTVNIVGNNTNLQSNGGTFTAGPSNLTSLATGELVAPILNASGQTAVSLTAGTGITSVTCATTCTAARGRLTLVNASATTGVLATVTITNLVAPICQWTQNNTGTGSYYGFYASSATTAAFTLAAGNSVSGVTPISATYECSQ